MTHAHPHAHRDADRRYLLIALALIAGLMAVDIVTAIAARSLALLADAGHMLTDAGAIGAAVVAAGLARRPPSETHTFGLKRAEILSAALNAVTLLVTGALIAYEAIRRLITPPDVHGGVVIVVACIGAGINVIAVAVLRRADRQSLNVEGAFQHVLTDLYAFAGTAIAGVVVVTTGFRRADPIASLVVVGLMVAAAVGLLRPAVRILAEATPEDMELAEVRRHILELTEVVSVHDLHAWTVGSGLPVLSAHVVVTDQCINEGTSARVLDHLQACLSGHFDVEHSTFQLEPIGHADHEPGIH